MVTSPELVGVLSAVEKNRSLTINSQYTFYIFVRCIREIMTLCKTESKRSDNETPVVERL